MNCPQCGYSKTSVINSISKESFTKRYRKCNKSSCGHRFTTTERLESDWDYKMIVLKIKQLLNDVK